MATTLGAALTAAPVEAANGTWTQAGTGVPYNWGDASNWLGGAIPDGTGSVATFNTPGLTVPMTVSLDTDRTVGGLSFSNPTNALGWTLAGPASLTLDASSGTPTVDVASPNLTATIGTLLFGSQGLTKTGTGTLVLTGPGFYSGPTNVTGGTLAVDFSAGQSSNILPGSTDLTLGGGGGLGAIVGAGQGATQSVNSVTLNPGAATIATTVGTGGAFNLALGTITRTPGSTLTFAPTGSGATVTVNNSNEAGGTLGGWATVVNPTTGQFGWAVSNAGTVGALTTYATGGAWATTNNTDMTTSGTISPAANSTTNSLRFNNGGSTNYVLNLSGTNTIASGGILVTPQVGGGAATFIAGGTLTSGNGSDLIVTQLNTFTPLTISSQLVGAVGLTTAGAGTTIVAGNNSYTGPTTVGGGTLLAGSPASLPGYNAPGMVAVKGGGTLAVSTSLVGPWAAADIATLLANASFTAGSALGFDVPTGAALTYGTPVSGALGLTKNNAGTLTLTGNNSYAGATQVNGGTLSAASIANAGTSSAIGAGTSLVLGTGGTLQYTGPTASVNRGITLNFNGGAIDVPTAGTNLGLSGLVGGVGGLTKVGAGTLTISGTGTYSGPTVVTAGTLVYSGPASIPDGNNLSIAAGATVSIPVDTSPIIGALNGGGSLQLGAATTLNLGADSASGSFRGNIASSVPLTIIKNGSGVQALFGANNHTGGTTVNAGTLLLSPQTAAANPLGTGKLTIASAGATVAYRQLVPIPTTGYNRDVMWGATEGSTAAQRVTIGFDFFNNQGFYAANVPGAPANTGLPANLAVNSAQGGGSTFILQPFNANNALFIPASSAGALTLGNPGSYRTLNVLASSTNGATTFNATLNFSDGTSTVVSGLSAPDWFNTTTNVAIANLNRYLMLGAGAGVFDTAFNATTPANGNPRMYQIPITLSAADQLKTLTSVTFQSLATAGTNTALGVFALNGTTVGAPASITAGNDVAIQADTTLEVSGYTSVGFGNLSVGTNSVTVNGSAGSTLSYAGTTLTGSPTFNVAAGVTTVLGTLTDGGAGLGLTKTGAGTLTVTGGSNYTGGPVAINGGTLIAGSPSALPRYTTAGQITMANGTSLSIGFGGAGQWTAAQLGTLLSNITFPAAASVGLDVNAGVTATYGAPLVLPTGIGFVKTGDGTLVMGANSTYTGSTSVVGGVLQTGSLGLSGSPSGIGASSAASGNLVFGNGALLSYTGATTTSDRGFTLNAPTLSASGGGFSVPAGTTLTLTGVGTGTGAFTKAGAGTVVLTGANTWSGGTTITGGTLQIGSGGTAGALGTGNILDNGMLTFFRADSATIAGAITGTGGVTKLGAGTLTLSGANGYTGPTVVSAGTLTASNPTALGTNSPVSVAAGATLATNGNAIVVGSLAGAGSVINGSVTASTLTVGDASSTTFSGAIQNGSTGSLALVKMGSGALTLTGTNPYSAGTTIAEGTINVSSDAALGTGPVTAGAFGALNYTATTATNKSFNIGGGSMTVSAGATLTVNGGQIGNGYLGGSGTIATSPATGARFAGLRVVPSVTVRSNSGSDRFTNVNNGGALIVAAALAAAPGLDGYVNEGSGSITVGAGTTVNAANFQSYGSMTLTPAVAGLTQLVNTGTAPLFLNGGSRTFVGTPATANNPTAAINVNGKNLVVSGGLLINNGAVYDGSGGSGTVVADYGATVKGAGIFTNGVQTINGGKFQAGNSPGLSKPGVFTFGPGGVNNYVWQISNAAGVAGPTPDAQNHVSGWSLVQVATSIFGGSGNFTWSADSANKLTFAVQTLIDPSTSGTDVLGPMSNFDPNANYSWPVLTYTGTYTGPADAAALNAATSFDLTGLANAHPGTFGWSLDTAGHTLSLNYVGGAVPEPGFAALAAVAAVGLLGARRRRRP